MIELALAMIVSTSPYDWQMTCEQTLEVIETVMMDDWFARPENRHHRKKLIRKMKSHGPPNCVPLQV